MLCTMPNVATAVWDLLKCLFGGLWSLGKCLFRRRESQPSEVKQNKRKLVEQPSVRKRFRKGHRNMKLDESVSASKASMDTVSESLDDIERVLDWSVRYENDRVMITTVLNGVELCFNPCSGKVEDVMGKRHLVCVPDISILSVAEDLRRSIRPPALVETEGLKRVKSDRVFMLTRPTESSGRARAISLRGMRTLFDCQGGYWLYWLISRICYLFQSGHGR
jgi:hypothetical protein